MKTFLFDLDGTLVDSLADLTSAINRLRGELDLAPIDLPTVKGYVGDGARMLVRRALPEPLFCPERLQHFLTYYGQVLLEQTRPYVGIPELLDHLKGFPMAVVTNKPLAMTEEILKGLGLRHYFGSVVGGDSCSEKKPHPAPVLKALEELRADAHGAVMTGDHHTDLLAGRAAGTRTCFCAWGFGRHDGNPYDFFAEQPGDLFRLFPGEGT